MVQQSTKFVAGINPKNNWAVRQALQPRRGHGQSIIPPDIVPAQEKVLAETFPWLNLVELAKFYIVTGSSRDCAQISSLRCE